MVETYLAENTRDGLPRTTIERRRAELAEFIEIVGDRPATAYTTRDGTAFNTVQDTLPSMRNVPPFRGLSLIGAGKKATQMIADGKAITLLNPVTIKNKVGAIKRFFKWAGVKSFKFRRTAMHNAHPARRCRLGEFRSAAAISIAAAARFRR